jgi:3-oxoacyl-[acyl-carrier-protein] synthase III
MTSRLVRSKRAREPVVRGAVIAQEDAMDNLTKKDQRDRSKINMHEDFEVKYWSKELGVSKEQLQGAVEKVGNSAAAVRKELGVMGNRH